MAEAWRTPFAPHLGVPTIDDPYFKASASGADPVSQIAYAHDLGFPAVFDLRLPAREAAEQEKIASAIGRLGMGFGTVHLINRTQDVPLFTSADPDVRQLLDRELEKAIAAAKRVGGDTLLLHNPRDPRSPAALQRVALVEGLKRIAERLEKAGMVVALEPVAEQIFPGRLITTIHDAWAVVEAVDSPAVGIAFDTAQIQAQTGDLILNFDRVASRVRCLQLRDWPTPEPGTGEINFVSVLRHIRASGYPGLFELEHRAVPASREREAMMLEWLRDLDRRI